jgi:hypothetical protein
MRIGTWAIAGLVGVVGMVGVPGCAQRPAAVRVQAEPPLMAPSTAMVRAPHQPLNPYAVLAGVDPPEFFVPRAERGVYGAYPIAGLSAFTTYTYDAQAISTPNGFGYRYRWVVQEGVSAPLVP